MLLGLPLEVLERVLVHLSGLEVLTLTTVCRQLRTAIMGNVRLWHNIYLRSALNWTWIDSAHADPALDDEQKYLRHMLTSQMMSFEFEEYIKSYMMQKAQLSKTMNMHAKLVRFMGVRKAAVATSVHNAQAINIGLIGINTSRHWEIIDGLMWGQNCKWPITGLHAGAMGIGSGVGFSVFQRNVNIRSVKESSIDPNDPRWITFLHSLDGVLLVVEPGNCRKINSTRHKLAGFLATLPLRQRQQKERNASSAIGSPPGYSGAQHRTQMPINTAGSSGSSSSSPGTIPVVVMVVDSHPAKLAQESADQRPVRRQRTRYRRVGIPAEAPHGDPDWMDSDTSMSSHSTPVVMAPPVTNASPSSSSSLSSSSPVVGFLGALGAETLSEAAPQSEWCCASVKVGNLTGMNEAMLWLLGKIDQHY